MLRILAFVDIKRKLEIKWMLVGTLLAFCFLPFIEVLLF